VEEANVERREPEPPFEGGAQPVPEIPPDMPGAGHTFWRTVMVVIAVLVIIAAIAWVLTPILR
jgi:hypothetical protein